LAIVEILKKYVQPATVLSAEPVKADLVKDLAAQKRFNSVVYGILFTAVCIVFVIAIVALTTGLLNTQSGRIKLLSLAGVTVPAMLEWIRRVVREWSQLSLLLTLVSHSDERAIQALLQKLLSSTALGLQPERSKKRTKDPRP